MADSIKIKSLLQQKYPQGYKHPLGSDGIVLVRQTGCKNKSTPETMKTYCIEMIIYWRNSFAKIWTFDCYYGRYDG